MGNKLIMENKYYTPIIEEFYIGFEYEHLLKDNFTGCSILCYPDIEDVYYDIPLNKVRVKYLDKSDIESLGYTQLTDDCFYISGISYRGRLDCEIRILIRDTVLIYILDKDDNNYILFTGIIKNKSELIKLLKMLNINA